MVFVGSSCFSEWETPLETPSPWKVGRPEELVVSLKDY